VLWSGTGDLVALTSSDSFYVIRFDREAYTNRVEAGGVIGDEGVEEAFDVVAEIGEVFVAPKCHMSRFAQPTASSVSKRPNGSAIALFTPTLPTD